MTEQRLLQSVSRGFFSAAFQDWAGESGPVLGKADGPDEPSGSFGVLFPMDAKYIYMDVHQPQGHL